MKLSVVLPAYNEEKTISRVLDAVCAADLSALPERVEKEIIVVDDASRDRTAAEAARHPGIVLVRHPVNRGKGAAIRTALDHVTGDVVLIQDADLEYSVADYPALLRPFFDPSVQVVYGSRFLLRRRPTGMRLQNFLANRLLTLAANLLYDMRITDEATCYKLFRASVIRAFPLRARGFEFCPEVTALTRLSGLTIHEVPVDYAARTHAEGKKIRWTDGVKALWTLLKYRLRGPGPAPQDS